MSLQGSESDEATSALNAPQLSPFVRSRLAVLFYYDHAITIGGDSDILAQNIAQSWLTGREINYLWKRPKRRSSYWFFANRYIPFFANIAITILSYMDLTPERCVAYSLHPHDLISDTRGRSCRRFTLFRQVFAVVNQIIVSLLLTLRVYALYECSSRILTFMLGTGTISIGIACLKWTLFRQQSTNSLEAVVGGCHIGLTRETAFRIATAWEAVFAYDCLIFTLTIMKTWKGRKNYAITGTRMPLITLILRDGAIYFAVMALANFGNVLTFYLGGTFLRGGLSMFSSSISITMMARLMLNLHERADDGLFTTQTMSTDLDWGLQSDRESTINFRSTGAGPSGLSESEHDSQMLDSEEFVGA
ncbi:hypothetical protein CPC08DRAFT_769155 [Agrocybe pediades]|nr:hypothetical protein CPC08DRAFT_769155 [Agrocybe pediades]